MPYRRGSFREDRNDLLERFAHRGTPAASQDQLRAATQKKRHSPGDIHHELFKRSQSRGDDQNENVN